MTNSVFACPCKSIFNPATNVYAQQQKGHAQDLIPAFFFRVYSHANTFRRHTHETVRKGQLTILDERMNVAKIVFFKVNPSLSVCIF